MIEVFEYFKTPPDLKIFKYSYPNAKSYHFGIVDNKTKVQGFGGDKDCRYAQTKALYELIERTVYHNSRISSKKTSSGWAAHQSINEAIRASEFELIERDAVLSSWLSKTSPFLLGSYFFPLFDKNFQLLQFGKGPGYIVLGVLLEHFESKSKMLISVCTENVDTGLQKLLNDAERAYFILSDPLAIHDPILKLHHDNICQSNDLEIQWLFGSGQGISYKSIIFENQLIKVPLWDRTEAYVCFSTSKDLQLLYYGREHFVNINRARFRSILKYPYKLNKSLHPIL